MTRSTTRLAALLGTCLTLCSPLAGWEVGCYLHPAGSTQTIGGHSCPAIDPWLRVEAGYRCEVCGDMGPFQDMEVTGYGECFVGSGACAPSLHSVSYMTQSLSIRILNRRILGVVCIGNGYSTGYTDCYCPTCEQEESPILISLADERYELTDAAGGVLFDLDADGRPEQTAWTAFGSDEAFLALDRNRNGYVDDYMEIFGNHTPQLPSKEPNGWLALAVWDDSLNGGNEDGVIDERDRIFAELRLWLDENHNGFSEPKELKGLEDLAVDYLDLDYGRSEREDEFGNEFRFWSRVGLAGEPRTAWDVFFVHE